MNRVRSVRAVSIVCAWMFCCAVNSGIGLAEEVVNPGPLRPLPVASRANKPIADAKCVDGARGDDANAGTIAAPWRSLKHAFAQLVPGDTLYLRGGVYREPAYIALAGTSDAPITIRSYPGELAILDGSLAEFADDPAGAWEPYADGAAFEYRSVRAYRNVRHVLGAFADSMIGLQVYHNPRDLRAANEQWVADGEEVAPLYCGPGLWYNRETGRIHIRLTPTDLKAIGERTYRGESDPRKVRLLISPMASVPLTLDGAEFVNLHDLVVRGAGFDTVWMRRCQDVEWHNVNVYCGTHGLRVETTVGLLLRNCAFRGQIPPWGFRSEIKHSYWGEENARDIVRLTGMALLLAETGKMYRFPQNRDWEIEHCEFNDGHDGVYLGGVRGVRFHHNRLDNLHDDGVYLSAWGMPGGDVKIYENHLSRCLTTFAFGELTPENRTQTGEGTYIYRNVIDLRGPVPYGRPTPENPAGTLDVSRLCGDHGSPRWEPVWFYHNTVLGRTRDYAFGIAGHTSDLPRQVFNNVFLYEGNLPSGPPDATTEMLASDGNWHHLFRPAKAADQAASEAKIDAATVATNFLAEYRASKHFQATKKWYPEGWCAHDRLADPGLRQVSAAWDAPQDFRLKDNSPAIDAGVPLPADWPDTLRGKDAGRPDIGAFPAGAALPKYGLSPGDESEDAP